RYILAILFLIYGIVVLIMGIGFTSRSDLDKADGINVNLWSGIAMLVVAVLFGLWARLRPVRIPEQSQDEQSQGEESATGE
ncbi:MAG: hypothetical protein ACRDQ5_06645, partial [Sciscionella sp.]